MGFSSNGTASFRTTVSCWLAHGLVHVFQFSKLHTIFPCDLLFYSENGGDRFIQTVATYWTNNIVSHPRTQCTYQVSSLGCVTLWAAIVQCAVHQTSLCGSKNKQYWIIGWLWMMHGTGSCCGLFQGTTFSSGLIIKTYLHHFSNHRNHVCS